MINPFDDLEDFPNRVGFRNFVWTHDAVGAWAPVWYLLWKCNVKWEWRNGDRYARQAGDTYTIFATHNDAAKLDMAIPLPHVSAIHKMASWLFETHVNNNNASEAARLIRDWIKDYVE